MRTTVVGNYPKIPSVKDGINLRKALNDFEKGKCSESHLEDVYRKSIMRCIDDQQQAGIDIITDGQIRWMELTYPIATSLISVQPGGLRRFYDNNVYYRRPQITGLMSRNKEIVTDDYRFASDYAKCPVKAVLCGPITFCDLSDNYYYKSFDKLAEAVAEIMREEVNSLVTAGCQYVQFDEPSLPFYGSRMELASDLYTRIFEGIEAEYGIFVYFNSIEPIADKLFDFPVRFFGLDLVSHPDDMELLDNLDQEKEIIAGLFDGRNIMLENEKTIRAAIDRLSKNVALDRVILSPSCGLEFLPQKHARAKMKRMCEVAQKLSPVKTR